MPEWYGILRHHEYSKNNRFGELVIGGDRWSLMIGWFRQEMGERIERLLTAIERPSERFMYLACLLRSGNRRLLTQVAPGGEVVLQAVLLGAAARAQLVPSRCPVRKAVPTTTFHV